MMKDVRFFSEIQTPKSRLVADDGDAPLWKVPFSTPPKKLGLSGSFPVRCSTCNAHDLAVFIRASILVSPEVL